MSSVLAYSVVFAFIWVIHFPLVVNISFISMYGDFGEDLYLYHATAKFRSFAQNITVLGQESHGIYILDDGVVQFDKLTDKPRFINDYLKNGDICMQTKIQESVRSIAILWADVNVKVSGSVHFKQITDTENLQKLKLLVEYAFREINNFDVTDAYIVTWLNTASVNDDLPFRFIGWGKLPVNNFQLILVTDGSKTFAIFHYHELTWTSGKFNGGDLLYSLGGISGLVGIFAGDFLNNYELYGSCTNLATNLACSSNVNLPGIHVFRVDEAAIKLPTIVANTDQVLCDIDVSMCDTTNVRVPLPQNFSDTCLPHGQCTIVHGLAACDCHFPWQGDEYCKTRTDFCGLPAANDPMVTLSEYCRPNGKCVNVEELGASCVCDDGWSGDYCEYRTNFCTQIVSLSPVATREDQCIHGSCESVDGVGASCICDEGWGGDFCDLNDDFCQRPTTADPSVMKSSLCDPHGTCVNVPEFGAKCVCNEGWSGDFCDAVETVTTTTVTNFCNQTLMVGSNLTIADRCMHGRCESIDGVGASCICDERWSGDFCDLSTCSANPFDVLFIVDGSNSISSNEWGLQTQFIQAIVAQFNVGPGETDSRVAYVQFSSDSRVEFDFNDHFTVCDLNHAIESVNQFKKSTNLGKGIQFAMNNVMKPTRGHRYYVPSIVVVLSDGESLDNPAPKATAMKNAGYVVYAIGVGGDVDKQQLGTVPSSEDQLLLASDFGQLNSFVTQFKCPVVQDDNCSTNPFDLLFIVDGSDSISANEWKQQTRFIQAMAARFNIGSGETNSRVAYVQFSTDSRVEFDFDDYFSISSLTEGIEIVQQYKRSTYLSKAITYAMDNVMTTARGHRSNVPSIVVVLSDGESKDDPESAATTMKNSGNLVYAIGIGGSVNKEQLGTVPSSEDKLLLANGFLQLDTIIYQFKCPME